MIGADAYIGKLIGNYRVEAEVNDNGFSGVYRGEQITPPERTVAIKLWYTIRLSSLKQLQFLQEVRLLKMLKHPHLLPILDGGIHEYSPYLIIEYSPKGSLQDRIGYQPDRLIPIQETLTILSQVGQALLYAHQLHIIHGNLKPENILFTALGDALLSDFAISKLMEAASSAHTDNIHTASYMAPEQFQGVTSEASDQYALGCIGYELLTGQVPFTAVDSSALALKHAKESPLPPTLLNMLLPARMEEAILKAMAKQQEARHANVKDFLTALGTVSIFQPRMLPVPVTPHSILPKSIEKEVTVISPIHDAFLPPRMRRKQASSRIVVPANLQAVSGTGTHVSVTETRPLLASSSIGSHHKRNQGSRLLRLTFITLSILITIAIISVFSFVLLPALSPRTSMQVTPLAITEVPPAEPSSGPSSVPSPIPSAAPSSTPTPTPFLHPSPMPSPKPSPIPTPSPSPATGLTVTPGQFNAQNDCSSRGHWYTCNVILAWPQNAQGEMPWSASSSGLNQVSFSPSAGVLSPGQRLQVVISVRSSCPATGSLIFSGSNTVTVLWSC